MTDFGPAVIGKKEFEKQQKARQGGGDRFGPLVLEHNKSRNRPAATPALKIVDGDVSSLSVNDLKELIAKDAGLVGQLLDAELERSDVRVTALKALQYAESTKARPDPGIIDRIKAAREELGDSDPGDEDTPPSALDVSVDELAGFLEEVEDAELIEAWKGADERSTAEAHYDARLAALAEAAEADEADGEGSEEE